MLPAYRAAKDRSLLGSALANYAAYLASCDDVRATVESVCELIEVIAPVDPSSVRIAIALEPLALALACQGDSERAALLEGYADAALTRAGFEREHTETTTFDRLVALLTASFVRDDLAQLFARGAALAPEDAIGMALAERTAAAARDRLEA